jgi:1-deoxy-D-xylulose-5-phosphate reductoisomerase
MVAYADGSVMAQMGLPDMKAAIAYALFGPERLPVGLESPDFAGIAALTFEQPDMEKFPCLALAYHACRSGGSYPAVLNAANEVAVEAFLSGSIGFVQIPRLIESVLSGHEGARDPDLSTILEADRFSRTAGEQWIRRHGEGVPA